MAPHVYLTRIVLPAVHRILPLLAMVHASVAAVLSIPSQNVAPGAFIVTSLNLKTEGSHPTALQFDLLWDPGLSLQFAPAAVLGGAGKLVQAAALQPRGIRVLVYSQDQQELVDGEVLKLFVSIPSAGDPPQLRIANTVAVNPDGDAIGLQADSPTFIYVSQPTGAVLPPEGVLNAASLRSGPVAPGEIVTLLGGFGIDLIAAPNIRVSVNGVPATILYAGGNQVNAIVPFALDPGGTAEFEVRNPDRQLARVTVPAAAASPALFTQYGVGIGPGAILNQDYSLNTPDYPADPDSVVMLFGTGFGPMDPPARDGQPGVYSRTILPVTARIGGEPAEVIYAGAAPDLISGLVQLNVRVPAGLRGNRSVAISITAGQFELPAGVVLFVK
jgi:uncharacterized protein (TIGR03437 family)